MNDIHVVLKGYGVKNKVLTPEERLLHFVLSKLDTDWPFCERFPHRGAASFDKMKICAKCGGRVYARARLKPKVIKTLARQLGVPLKIMKFSLESKCFKPGEQKRFKV